MSEHTQREITAVIQERCPRRQLHLRRIHLRVVEGPDEGMDRLFEVDAVQVGTRIGSDVQLSDTTVSRSHAELVRTPGGILLRDLGSTNGVFVGAIRIKEVYLGPHQRFSVGRTVIELVPADEVVEIVPSATSSFEGLVGESVAMREVFSVLERVALTDLTVMITGETGTGKDLVAQALHRRSLRQGEPFVVFDCGSVPHNLIESELFGHEKGAYTGAHTSQAGVFEAAHRGTLFLDELGELPLDLQPSLLRVLESRRVRRVGGHHTRKVDVRIVTATHRDLRELVAEGLFREDLYYRLAVVELALPPLRERREDLPMLSLHLLRAAGFPHALDPEVEEVLRGWRWPGNVRELRNVLTRAASFAEADVIRLRDLPQGLGVEQGAERQAREEEPAETPASLKEARDQVLDAFERQYLEGMLERTGGNLSEAARLAGVDRKTLGRMIKRHGLR
ncbi:MAG: sigma 54-dependent Fis family transcriptional regulator [Deltaproteobacteria bacterium]|nr:sigma 54-dependent Fis family transcriptional regulator [Deltaproteobacteria bacterium]